MAKITTRGTVFQLTISASLTTIAQCTDFSTGETKSRTIDVECMDDTGHSVAMMNDDVVTQGEGSASILYDPDSTVHQFITDSILAGATSFPIAGAFKFSDATPASATFSAVGLGFGVSASVKDVLKANVSIAYAGTITWPT
ncbi:MAG: hypothetical protein E6Q97_06475 [Desulfurellales bacterium]|nr:MAG: hypothetical protein E6Q97_06475 [Desulfurellales bacterium]